MKFKEIKVPGKIYNDNDNDNGDKVILRSYPVDGPIFYELRLEEVIPKIKELEDRIKFLEKIHNLHNVEDEESYAIVLE